MNDTPEVVHWHPHVSQSFHFCYDGEYDADVTEHEERNKGERAPIPRIPKLDGAPSKWLEEF